MTRITITQENKEFYKAFKKALNSKDETLTSFCEKHKLDYMLTYQRLNASKIELNYLKELYGLLQSECWFRLSVGMFGELLHIEE